ncbi:MAG: hypothetical protein ACKPGT_16010 [Microcystis sp.]|nr:hypothetical protein [Microcystis panniformis WG22]
MLNNISGLCDILPTLIASLLDASLTYNITTGNPEVEQPTTHHQVN